MKQQTVEATDDFVFDEKAHAYFLNGKPMLGCTSVLGVIAKPALIQWAANEAVKYVKEQSDLQDDGEHWITTTEVLDQAKTAHRKKKEDAADKGTDLHALVEEYVGACLAKGDGLPFIFPSYEDGTDNHYTPILPFIKWVIKEQIRFIATEQRLYSKQLWVAGTCDLLFEKGGKRYIVDIKTYKKIWDRVPLIQCAGYALMREEMSGFHMDVETRVPNENIDGYCVICLPKERAFNEAEDVLWSFDPQADKEAFISAVNLYKYLQVKI